MQDADDRGDLYLQVSTRLYFSNAYWLLRDEPELAQQEADDALARWTQTRFTFQHVSHLFAAGAIALYRGEPQRGWDLLQSQWLGVRRTFTLRKESARIHLTQLRARLALALGPGAAASARRDAAALQAEAAPWAGPLGELIEAALHSQRGDLARACEQLQSAEQRFEALDMQL